MRRVALAVILFMAVGCATAPPPRPLAQTPAPAASPTPAPPTAAGAAPIMGALAATGTLTLSWTNGLVQAGQPAPTQTDIERTTAATVADCTVNTPGWTTLASVPWAGTSYSDTTVAVGTVYCYRVKALLVQAPNPPLSSGYSNIAGGTPGGGAPPGDLPAPVLQSITPS